MPPVQQQGVTILGPANINRGVVLCKQSPLRIYKPLEHRCCFYIRQSDKLPLVLLKGTISSVILLFSTCQNFNLHYKFSMFNAAYIIPSKVVPLVSSWADVTGRTVGTILSSGAQIKQPQINNTPSWPQQHRERKCLLGPLLKYFCWSKEYFSLSIWVDSNELRRPVARVVACPVQVDTSLLHDTCFISIIFCVLIE